MFDLDDEAIESVGPRDAAEAIGLRYVSDASPGISRKKVGKNFTYRRADGAKVTDSRTRERIRSLVIPPAWTDVWICASPNGHIQATGRDGRGRKQYCYHPLFREAREGAKYEHLFDFADALPAIRLKVREHMALRGLMREKVLATVVYLLEATLIRIGNDAYARRNKSFGLTTLKARHVAIEGSEIRFQFTGKSGKQWSLAVKDRRIAKIIRACQELPGQDLLQYLDDEGQPRAVTSADVNDYLREIAGRPITAKDFRTFAGTVMAALALIELGAFESERHARKNLRAAIASVAARLGNTPAICRKCYIHPEVLDAYGQGHLVLEIDVSTDVASEGLLAEEAAVLAMLRARLATRLARAA